MSINVIWDNVEKTILRYDFDAQWRVEELYTAIMLGKSMINDVLHHENLGVLMVLPKKAYLPTDPLPLLRHVLERQHHRVIVVVFVSDTLYVQVLRQTLHEAFPVIGQTLLHTRTLEEGRSLAMSHLGNRMLQTDKGKDFSLGNVETVPVDKPQLAYDKS